FNNEQSYGGAASSENFTTVTRLTDDGYVVEAAIKLNFAAKKGMVIGFDGQVNDDQNDDGSRDSVSIWEDASGQSYQNTSRIGVLEFTNKPNNKRYNSEKIVANLNRRIVTNDECQFSYFFSLVKMW